MNEIEEKETDKKDVKWGILIALGITILWFVSPFIIDSILRNSGKFGELEFMAQFGDSFGLVNSLFSGLALGGIIYTIILQKKELRLQREELKLTRGELKQTRGEFELQNKTMSIQQFETTFFNLINLHNNILDSISQESVVTDKNFKHVNHTYYGVDAFRRFVAIIKQYSKDISWSNDTEDLKRISDVMIKLQYNNDIKRYFSLLYQILKSINDLEINSKYVSIIRSQLSDSELIILFYYVISKNNESKFKELIERFSMFKYIDTDNLFSVDHCNFYSPKAFSEE